MGSKKRIKGINLKKIPSLVPKKLNLIKFKVNPVDVIEDTKNKIGDFYSNFNDVIGGSVSPIVHNGYLFLLDDKIEEAKARVQMQQGAGLSDVEFLDSSETAKRFSFVDPDLIKGSTWCPSDGFLRPGIVYGEAAQAV